MFDSSDAEWLASLGGSRHYLYSIHSSRSFLFIPTVGAGLYLLLLRYLAHQYEEVCRLAVDAICFSDDLQASSEEEQIWELLLTTFHRHRDLHPDAHACRIRIWLAAYRQGLAVIPGTGGGGGASARKTFGGGGRRGGEEEETSLDESKGRRETYHSSVGKGAGEGGLRKKKRVKIIGSSSTAGGGENKEGLSLKERRKKSSKWFNRFINQSLLQSSTAYGQGESTSSSLSLSASILPGRWGGGGDNNKKTHTRDRGGRRLRRSPSAAVVLYGWDVFKDLLCYVRASRYVSAGCRLSPEDELELLRLCPAHIQGLPEITNRVAVLVGMLQRPPSSSSSSPAPQPRPTSSLPPSSRLSSESAGRAPISTSLDDGCDSDKVPLSVSEKETRPIFPASARKEEEEEALVTTVSSLIVPTIPHIDDFDSVDDRSCLQEEDDSMLASLLQSCGNLLSTFTPLRRPSADKEDLLSGPDAIAYISKYVDRGFKMSDFLFLYELLTDSFPLRVIPGEAPHVWGKLLTRFLPSWDFRSKNSMISILRLLMSNPSLVGSFPHLQENEHYAKKSRLPSLGIVFRSQEPFQKFLKDIHQVILQLKESGKLIFPQVFSSGLPSPVSTSLLIWRSSTWQNRDCLSLKIPDYACNQRQIHPVASHRYSRALDVYNFEHQKFSLTSSSSSTHGLHGAGQPPKLQQASPPRSSSSSTSSESRPSRSTAEGDAPSAPSSPLRRTSGSREGGKRDAAVPDSQKRENKREGGEARTGADTAQSRAEDLSRKIRSHAVLHPPPSCEVQLTRDLIEVFTTQPLKFLELGSLIQWEEEQIPGEEQKEGQRGEEGRGQEGDALPFSLDHHPAAKTPIGKSTLDRLRQEVALYTEKVGNGRGVDRSQSSFLCSLRLWLLVLRLSLLPTVYTPRSPGQTRQRTACSPHCYVALSRRVCTASCECRCGRVVYVHICSNVTLSPYKHTCIFLSVRERGPSR